MDGSGSENVKATVTLTGLSTDDIDINQMITAGNLVIYDL